MSGDFRQSGTLFPFHPVTDIFVTESIKCVFTSIFTNIFYQNSYIDMFSSKISSFIANAKH